MLTFLRFSNPLKRIPVILFLALLIFSLGGYYMLFFLLQSRATQQLEARLDAGDYNLRSSLVIRTPMLLPYSFDWKSYQRVDGELIYHGQHYNAVKQRVSRDTMYTFYVKDAYKNKLYQGFSNTIGLFTGLPVSGNSNLHIWDNLFREYLPDPGHGLIYSPAHPRLIQYCHMETGLTDPVSEVPTPPPDLSVSQLA